MKVMEKIIERPHALIDVPMHYCPGCGHGIIHRLVAEAIEKAYRAVLRKGEPLDMEFASKLRELRRAL